MYIYINKASHVHMGDDSRWTFNFSGFLLAAFKCIKLGWKIRGRNQMCSKASQYMYLLIDFIYVFYLHERIYVNYSQGRVR